MVPRTLPDGSRADEVGEILQGLRARVYVISLHLLVLAVFHSDYVLCVHHARTIGSSVFAIPTAGCSSQLLLVWEYPTQAPHFHAGAARNVGGTLITACVAHLKDSHVSVPRTGSDIIHAQLKVTVTVTGAVAAMIGRRDSVNKEEASSILRGGRGGVSVAFEYHP